MIKNFHKNLNIIQDVTYESEWVARRQFHDCALQFILRPRKNYKLIWKIHKLSIKYWTFYNIKHDQVLSSKYKIMSTTCSEGALGSLGSGWIQSDESDSEKDSGIFSQSLAIPRLQQRRPSIQTFTMEQ